MPINILMPALSPTMEKGNLAKWLKKEGDTIKSGDVIAEIETDKATMEVEAVDEGILAKIVVPEGTADVPVNQLIAVIAGEGEDPKSVTGAAAAAAPAPKAEARRRRRPQRQRRAAGRHAAAAPARLPRDGSSGSPRPARREAQRRCRAGRAASSPRRSPSGSPRKRASTSLRPGLRPAWPHRREGRSKSAVAGGTARSRRGSCAPHRRPEAAPRPRWPADASADQVKAMFEPGTYEEIPLDGMRKTIAKRLVESKQTVPHFYLSLDCELDALMALREQINARPPKDKDGKPAYKLSVNDFVIKALAIALQRVPAANAVWAEDRILRMQALGCGRGGRDRRRPVHAGDPQGGDEDADRDLRRDEGPRRPRPQPPPEARGVHRAARRRSRISACSASRTSRPSSTRRRARSSRSARASSASW